MGGTHGTSGTFGTCGTGGIDILSNHGIHGTQTAPNFTENTNLMVNCGNDC